LARLSSSSVSFSGLAAPLSRVPNSLNTSCICSGLGLRASHSRIRAARSPEVAAENAPPVRASSGCGSWDLGEVGVTAGASEEGLRLEKLNIPLFSPGFAPRRAGRPHGRKARQCWIASIDTYRVMSLVISGTYLPRLKSLRSTLALALRPQTGL